MNTIQRSELERAKKGSYSAVIALHNGDRAKIKEFIAEHLPDYININGEFLTTAEQLKRVMVEVDNRLRTIELNTPHQENALTTNQAETDAITNTPMQKRTPQRKKNEVISVTEEATCRTKPDTPAKGREMTDNKIGSAICAGTHISEVRGNRTIDAKGETNRILFAAFTAARRKKTLGEWVVIDNRYKTRVVGAETPLGEAEENLIYALLEDGVRNNCLDGIFTITPRACLNFAGRSDRPGMRQRVMEAARNMLRVGVNVIDLTSEDGAEYNFFLVRRVYKNAPEEIQLKLSLDMISIFDYQGFALCNAKRKKLQMDDARRLFTYLASCTDFDKGHTYTFTKQQLENDIGCAKQPMKKPDWITNLIADFDKIGITVKKIRGGITIRKRITRPQLTATQSKL